MNILMNVLSAGDSAVLGNLETTSMNIFDTIAMYIYIAIGFALVGCGCLYIFGSEEGKMKANKWLPRIVVGAGLIVCAVSGGQWIADLFVS